MAFNKKVSSLLSAKTNNAKNLFLKKVNVFIKKKEEKLTVGILK